MLILEIVTDLYELRELTEPLVNYAIAPAIIAAIGLAAQLGGSIYSGIKSKQANEEAKREADKLKREQDEMYRQQRAEAETLKQSEGNFLDTAMGKGMITEMQQQYQEAIKRGTANGLKREMTDEAKQANTQTANEQLTNSMRNVAQTGTNYRLGILGMVNDLRNRAYAGRNSALNKYSDFNIAMADAKNQSALNLGQNFNQLGNNLTNTASKWDDKDSFGKWFDDWRKKRGEKKIISGMNNSQLGDVDYTAVANDFFNSLVENERNKPY